MKNEYGKITGLAVLGTSLLCGAATFAQQITPCFPPPSGLVAWYQGEGDATDHTGVNNGTIVNSLGFTGGEVNAAFAYAAFITTGYVSVPSSTSLRSLTNGLTIETWIRPNQTNSQLPLVEWNNGSVPGVHFWISVTAPGGVGGPGCLYANLIDTSANAHIIASNPGILTTNEFQHVAVTYDKGSGIAKLYLNGVPVKTANLGSFAPQVSYDLLLGKRLPTSDIYDGVLDEVSIYRDALSDCDIQSIYLMGTQGKCP